MVAPTISKTNNSASRIHDANGFSPLETFIQTGFGGAYDRQRMILKHELQDLETDFLPKMSKAGNDLSCLGAAEEALSLMQNQINKIPQPSWVSDPKQFSDKMDGFFKAAARAADIPQRAMDNTIGRYNLYPTTPGDVSGRVAMVTAQIEQMDKLVKNIDQSFNQLAQIAKSPAEFKAWSEQAAKQGVVNIDTIYAIDPGHFKPKDHNGNPVEYDQKNLIHSLQAIEHFLKDPASAMREGMTMFGPKGVEYLRMVMSDRMPAPDGANHGVSNSIIDQINGQRPGAPHLPDPRSRAAQAQAEDNKNTYGVEKNNAQHQQSDGKQLTPAMRVGHMAGSGMIGT